MNLNKVSSIFLNILLTLTDLACELVDGDLVHEIAYVSTTAVSVAIIQLSKKN